LVSFETVWALIETGDRAKALIYGAGFEAGGGAFDLSREVCFLPIGFAISRN